MLTNDFVDFLIYVIPGFIALEIYHAAYPVKRRSDFSKISWSVIYGLGISLCLKIMDQKCLGDWLCSSGPGFPSRRFIASLLVAGVLVGYWKICWRKIKVVASDHISALSFLYPDPQSIWAEVNQPKNRNWAVVYLDDDAIYLGWISEFSFDPNEKEQDFLLTKASRVDDMLKPVYEIDGNGVYLSTKNISRIEFISGAQSRQTNE